MKSKKRMIQSFFSKIIMIITCLTLLINLALLQPGYAADIVTDQSLITQNELDNELSVFNMVLFYAGIVGAIAGVLSGWVFWLGKPVLPSNKVPHKPKPEFNK